MSLYGTLMNKSTIVSHWGIFEWIGVFDHMVVFDADMLYDFSFVIMLVQYHNSVVTHWHEPSLLVSE